MPTIVACPRHPDVETALRCSRCGTPICPRCLVQTPVGARCRDCARITKSPIYTVTAGRFALGAATALVGGVIMGLIWGVILLPFSVGFWSIFIGIGLGYVFTKAMDMATNRKRGPVIVSLASAGIVIAWAMQFLFVGSQIVLYDLVAVGIGVYMAYYNLRQV